MPIYERTHVAQRVSIICLGSVPIAQMTLRRSEQSSYTNGGKSQFSPHCARLLGTQCSGVYVNASLAVNDLIFQPHLTSDARQRARMEKAVAQNELSYGYRCLSTLHFKVSWFPQQVVYLTDRISVGTSAVAEFRLSRR